MTKPGILAIWNNVKAGHEAAFEEWFQGEHLIERLGVPGFIYGRRHQAISGASAMFNFYLVESPAVLTSKAYLERLDNPTPMTHKIMTGVFLDMNRTICHRTVRRGAFRGAYVVTVRFDETPDEKALTARLDDLTADPAIAAGEIWIADEASDKPVSLEEKLRGGDRKIKGALMIDTLRQADAEKLGDSLQTEFPNAQVGVFRVLCQIGEGTGP